ncbi:MAG TPA: M28 family peptidase [Bacteroidota bacterium]|nr:M28 family peptidase [Bacteroidota bacterium]
MKTRVVLLALLAHSILVAQSTREPAITVVELREHLAYLASDALKGRKAGSPGEELAAQYIAKEFAAAMLKPMGINDTYFQPFEFVAGISLGAKNHLTATVQKERKEFEVNIDFRPIGFSASGSYDGELVFAGYGITAQNAGYDDYENIDVKGKAVLLLRFHPEGDSQHSQFGLQASLRAKATRAREMGAKAILVVTGPADAVVDELMPLAYDQSFGNSGILAVNITQKTADALLKGALQGNTSDPVPTLKELQEGIKKNKRPNPFSLGGVSVRINVDVREERKTAKNVVGLIEGSDPQLKNEVVVIGAHFDHLGMGGEGSGSLKPDTIAIHNGADDNASGTSGLIELAEYFVSRRNELKRSLLFIAFSAEEMGLLGSSYFVNNPTIPLHNIVAMLNMDMIGRLNDRKLIVYGIGTSPGFEALVTKQNKDSLFALKLNKDGFGPSDHSSFYAKQIPVFHFFTDLHADYHRPSDDFDRINYEGLRDVLQYVAQIGFEIANSDNRPAYAEGGAPRPVGGGRSSRSYTGTVPDFGEQVEGMKLSGVREGSPAAKAGLQAGDIIVKFGKVEIKNLYDYTFALGEYKPGDEVDVVVKRGTEVRTFRLVIGQRN